jgi:hypothetical protein
VAKSQINWCKIAGIILPAVYIKFELSSYLLNEYINWIKIIGQLSSKQSREKYFDEIHIIHKSI